LEIFAGRLPVADATVLVEAGAWARLGILWQRARLDIEAQRPAVFAEIAQQPVHRGSRLDTGLYQDRSHTELLQQQDRFAVLLGVN
jgi:hypothetical protein